ncbi:hypothetical protein ACVQH5_29350 [Klebsiella pneumoniae]
MKVAIRLLVLFALVGCQTTGGSFCGVAKPIRPSKETIAHLTDAEVSAILSHNRKLTQLCGVKP